jgi:tryptophanyl-tRNA synthetase
MSKSYNNSILISENSDTLKHKIENMFTDPLKIRKNDIGHPHGCIVFSFNNVFNKNCNDLEEKCRTGKIGCMTCKKQLIEIIHEFIKPFSENRKKIISDKRYLESIISSGCDRAIRIAEKTIKKIYEVLKF